MANQGLQDLIGNLDNIDGGGCPAPFIGESLHPFRGGCELANVNVATA